MKKVKKVYPKILKFASQFCKNSVSRELIIIATGRVNLPIKEDFEETLHQK